MYSVGEKIVYGENGVCTVIKIAPLEISGASKDKLYYYLAPLIGTGVYYSPVDSGAFMRPVISREEAEALIDAIPTLFIRSFSSSTAARRWSPSSRGCTGDWPSARPRAAAQSPR